MSDTEEIQIRQAVRTMAKPMALSMGFLVCWGVSLTLIGAQHEVLARVGVVIAAAYLVWTALHREVGA